MVQVTGIVTATTLNQTVINATNSVLPPSIMVLVLLVQLSIVTFTGFSGPLTGAVTANVTGNVTVVLWNCRYCTVYSRCYWCKTLL